MKIQVTCTADEMNEVFAQITNGFLVKDYIDLNNEEYKKGTLKPGNHPTRIEFDCELRHTKKQWTEPKPKEHLICLDLETTGLDPYYDEILQITILDGHGKVLLDEYCRPERVEAWEEAQAINHITPEMVRDKKPFSAYIAQIDKLLEDAEIVVGYNSNNFDLEFLKNAGVQIDAGKEKHYFDVMVEFAPIYGEWDDYHHDYCWQKLWTCADYYHYNEKCISAFDKDGYFYEALTDGKIVRPHNSLDDAKATLYCYYAVEQDLAERNLICATAESPA